MVEYRIKYGELSLYCIILKLEKYSSGSFECLLLRDFYSSGFGYYILENIKTPSELDEFMSWCDEIDKLDSKWYSNKWYSKIDETEAQKKYNEYKDNVKATLLNFCKNFNFDFEVLE